MENIIKPREKETSSYRIRKMFGINGNKENFQNSVDLLSSFSNGVMTRELLSYRRQAELTKDEAITLIRHSTRPL